MERSDTRGARNRAFFIFEKRGSFSRAFGTLGKAVTETFGINPDLFPQPAERESLRVSVRDVRASLTRMWRAASDSALGLATAKGEAGETDNERNPRRAV